MIESIFYFLFGLTLLIFVWGIRSQGLFKHAIFVLGGAMLILTGGLLNAEGIEKTDTYEAIGTQSISTNPEGETDINFSFSIDFNKENRTAFTDPSINLASMVIMFIGVIIAFLSAIEMAITRKESRKG